MKIRIQKKKEPNYKAWLVVRKNCKQGLSQKPRAVEKWAIPGFYDGHNNHEQAVEGLRKDSTLSYEEALCFRITGESKYAQQSIRIIEAWSNTLKSSDPTLADTKLSMNEFISPMIVAADLLEASSDWKEPQKQSFKKFLREIVLPLSTMEPKQNNHANWGSLLALSVATYTDDLKLFEKAEARLKELMEIQIGEDGTMLLEYDRSNTKNWHGGPTKGKNGIWYSNYALLPMTLAAEILFQNGRDLYSYETPKGKSLEMAFKKIAMWNRNPKTFPFYESNHGAIKGTKAVSYFEILNSHWPNKNAESLLKVTRPLTSEAGIPHLTFTHGGF